MYAHDMQECARLLHKELESTMFLSIRQAVNSSYQRR